MNSFGERLTALLEERNISISKVAKEVGIAKSTLHGILNGSETTLSKVVIIAEYLNVSVDYLATGRTEKVQSNDEIEVIQAEIKSKGLYEIRIIKKRE